MIAWRAGLGVSYYFLSNKSMSWQKRSALALGLGSLAVVMAACSLNLVQQVPGGSQGASAPETPAVAAPAADGSAPATPSAASSNTTSPTIDMTKLAAENRITLETNQGKIVLRLYADRTPNTVKNFAELAGKGFYDGLIFHRVIKSFMIQGGDPRGDGTGGPGYRFGDEIVGLSNKRGTISMANAGPNTNGSQFFINVVDNTFLDQKHAVFGEVVEGMEVVDAITRTETGPGDRPVKPVLIEKAAVAEDLLAWAKGFAWTVSVAKD